MNSTSMMSKELGNAEALYRSELIGKSGRVNAKMKKAWYAKGAETWEAVPATLDGIMGGCPEASSLELASSKAFISKLPDMKFGRAIDCGAGIGRITKGLLSKMFHEVELVEQNATFIKAAREALQHRNNVVAFHVRGLQDFVFTSKYYDVVWIQWVLEQLTDTDVVQFLKRASRGLHAGGYIVVKENCLAEASKREEYHSVFRTDAQWRSLASDAGLKLIKTEADPNLSEQIYCPVRMYAFQA
jgi:protein N-terminal methyltransferase